MWAGRWGAQRGCPVGCMQASAQVDQATAYLGMLLSRVPGARRRGRVGRGATNLMPCRV